MWQSLLPGLREVRAPLAAGYALAAAVWIFFHDGIRQTADSNGSLTATREMLQLVGTPGRAVAASFCLYLVGTLLVSFSNYLFQISTAPVERSESRLRHRFEHLALTRDSETQLLVEQLREMAVSLEASASAAVPDPPVATAEDIADQLEIECKGIWLDARLLIASERIYDEVTRLRSEAELRAAVLLPGALLAVAIATDIHWGFLAECALVAGVGVVLTALMIQASRIRTTARRLVMRAVVDNVVTTPTIDRLQRVAQHA